MFYLTDRWTMASSEEVLVVGIWKKKPFSGIVKSLDEALAGQLGELKKQTVFPKKSGGILTIPTLGLIAAKRIYAIYLGEEDGFGTDELRECLGHVGKQLKKERVETAGVLLDSFVTDAVSAEDAAFGIGEGIALGSYDKQTYKEKSNEPIRTLAKVTLYSNREGLTFYADRGYTYGKGTNLARKLVNMPGNLLTPSDLANESEALAKTYGFAFNVLEREDMERFGMGALLAVANGSDQPPKMIIIRYDGNPESDDVTGLVGKGITFDSGGYSLKPPANMHEMKNDMGGAAAVLGAMAIIGEMKPKVNVLTVIPSSENLINGSAMKPGDVICSLSGKTIEMRNADAEGRLVLADGITYAKQLGAKRLIDVATLTGACVVALGHETTGAVANDDALMEAVKAAGDKAGEPIWQFPSGKGYKKLLESSDIADLNNSPGRPGASITAGLFIGAFAEKTPWVHLDIAGTGYLNKATTIGPAGATGVMARTLAHYVESLSEA
ncbi:putative cytosol aminopeptidase [Shouchella clausii]|nr:putative cytosol aminopeptidase [Shouchella clausii]